MPELPEVEVVRRGLERHVVGATIVRVEVLHPRPVRRDLRELARDGALQRVHGGALPASPAVQNLEKRQAVSTAEKTAIGRAAAALIRPGQVVFIDGGTTAVQLARQIDPGLRATLVTHSPLVAAELADHAAEVILIGGRLFRHSMVATGTMAMEAIARIRAELFFLGVTGIHAELGLTTGDAEEAAIKRAFIAAAAETVVLASPEKLGAASAFLVAPVSEVATIMTTQDVDPAALRAYERLGPTVMRVPL